MPRILITAQVEDLDKWEEGFRTHGDIFRDQTVTSIHFAKSEGNEVAVYFEMDDLEKYMEILESPVTTEAMGSDGINRDTLKVHMLDNEFEL